MSKLMIIASNTTWLVLDRVLRGVVGLVIGAWTARYLGPEQYGSLAYVVAFVALFQCVTALGIDLVIASELPNPGADVSRILGTSLRLRMLSGVGGWSAALVTMAALGHGDREALLLTSLVAAVLIFQPSEIVDLWFQSKSQSRRAIGPRLSAFFVTSIARVWMLLWGAPLWAFALAYLAEAAMATALLAYVYARQSDKPLWVWDASYGRHLMAAAWPLLVSSLSIVLYARLDQIFVRLLAGEVELGKYSAILPFSQFWQFIPATVCVGVTPMLVRAFAESRERLGRYVSALFFLLFWLAMVISGIIVLSSSLIVGKLLGQEYEGSASILSIHALSIVPVFLTAVQVRYLSVIGRTRLMTHQAMIGLAVSVSMNLLLIPPFGALGAAVGFVTASTASMLYCNARIQPRCFGALLDVGQLRWVRAELG